MTISVSCDECFQEYRLNESLAGKKVKCKECGAVIKVPAGDAPDDLDFLDDGEAEEEEDDDDRPRKRGAKRPPLPKAKTRRSETPPPIPSKKASKGKKRSSGYRDALDDVPTWVVLSVMWTMIGIMCVLFWVLGARKPGDIAHADDIWNLRGDPAQKIHNPATVPPAMPAALFPVAQVPVPPLPDMPPLAQIFAPPAFTTSVTLQPGTTPGAGAQIRIWMPGGQPAERSLGCVFMVSESFSFLNGSAIGDLSNPQDLSTAFPLLQPFLSAGYAVVTFSIDGEVREQLTLQSSEADFTRAWQDAHQRFKAGFAGLVNLRNAVEWVSTKVNAVNTQKMYIAGVDEAGAFALLGAAHEPRLKGCLVVNPQCNLLRHYAEDVDIDELPYQPAGTDTEFLGRCSPNNHVADIQCPVYVCSIPWAVGEDETAPGQIQDGTMFAKQLEAANKKVGAVILGPGTDYLVVVHMGAQQGIAWLKAFEGAPPMPPM